MHGLHQSPITIRHYSLIVPFGLLLGHGNCNIHIDIPRPLITTTDRSSTKNDADTNSRQCRYTYYAKVGSKILRAQDHTTAMLDF